MTIKNDKDTELWKKRFMEMADATYYRGYHSFSDFLNLNEQSIFMSMINLMPEVSYMLWGGHELAERKILCIYMDEPKKEDFPITVLKISPKHFKFAETLAHRDYLGAVLNLGIDRSKIGDILTVDKEAYLFVDYNIKDYIIAELNKVRHTNVNCIVVEETIAFNQQYKEIIGTVSSIRLDTLIALAFQSSRSSLLGMISGGKVFINGCLITSNSFRPNEGDIISVRGKGKFIFYAQHQVTKKGKIKVSLRRYM